LKVKDKLPEIIISSDSDSDNSTNTYFVKEKKSPIEVQSSVEKI
jgi:hypothetical protein